MADSDDLLVGVKATLQTALDQLITREAELAEDLAEARANRKRVESTLTMLTGKKKTTAKKVISTRKPQTADQILEFMQASEDEDWTASRLSEGLEIHSSTVSKSLNWLRENNLIRATRTVRGGGHAYAAWTE
jgi:response regulator of citrate/malate metabolism